jgi:AraC-like DNA-binding protein
VYATVGIKCGKETALMLEDFNKANDALFAENADAQLDELRTKYDVDTLELKNAKQQQAIFFALGAVLLLLVIVVLIFIIHQKIRRKNISLVAQIKELQELQQIKEDELLQKNTFETPEIDAAELCPESRKDKICIALRDLLLKDKIYRNETLSRDSLTKKLGINRHNLEDAFLFCFSMHFSEYINVLRLRDAVVMLEASDVSIVEISEKVGFATLRTFQRQFTAKYNISPKDYRALAKKK